MPSSKPSPFATSNDAASREAKQPDRVSWSLLLIYFLLAVYMVAQATQFPMLPYLWTSLGGTAIGFGVMMSEFGGLQLVGNLLSGPFLDAMGARVWLGISFIAAAFVAACTALATKPWHLYASRIPAMLELGPLCVRVLITERSSEADRARLLGYSGVALGVGLVLGPILGGQLANTSNQLCAWVAGAICLAEVLLVPFIPAVSSHTYSAFPAEPGPESPASPGQASPERASSLHRSSLEGHFRPRAKSTSTRLSSGILHVSGSNRSQILDDDAVALSLGHITADPSHITGPPARIGSGSGGKSEVPRHLEEGLGHEDRERREGAPPPPSKPRLQQIWTTLVEPGVPSIIAIKACVGLGMSIVQTTLSFLLENHYQLPAKASGGFISYVGVLAILVQGFVIGPVSRHVTLRTAVLTCGWAAVVLSLGFALSGSSVWILCATVGPLIMAILVLETLCTAQLTKLAPAHCKATVLSIESGLMGGLMLVAPSVGTGLYSVAGFASLGLVAAALDLLLMALVHVGIVAI